VDDDGVPLAPIVRETSKVDSTDPLIGIRYEPVRGLMFRGSYSTGFLPPAVDELVAFSPFSLVGTDFGLTDPELDEPVGAFTYFTGGSPRLDPEQSESTSFGIVWSPTMIPALRLSADWTKIEKEDAIVSIGALSQDGLDSLVRFAPERITRDVPAPGQSVGPIIAVDDTLLNISRANVEALDLAFNYELTLSRAGRLGFALSATRLVHNQTVFTPDAPVVENVGLEGNVSWRANATLDWQYASWTVGWATRYFDSTCVLFQCAFSQEQNARTLPSQTYHDLYLGYDFSKRGEVSGALSGLRIELGINNVFDEEPPIDAMSGYSRLGDPRLSNYWIGLRKSFSR
jgi:iron complex outermembrane receptor protein